MSSAPARPASGAAPAPQPARPDGTSAAALVGPTWRRAKLWLVLAAIVVVAAVVLSSVSSTAVQPLDPNSAAPDGSKALVALLAQRGTTVHERTSVAAALAAPEDETVLVAGPDELGSSALKQLVASKHRIVAVAPGDSSLAALGQNRTVNETSTPRADPSCSWAGGPATGRVDFPSDTLTYSGPDSCYGGAVVVTGSLVVLGSQSLLENDKLASSDIAALDINALSADGTVSSISWLPPDATGGTPVSVWQLFPPWAERAFWWMVLVGLVCVLWRARRLGPVVREPLPVVVRAAELVEGHGRLYRRARARDRAAQAFRDATLARLTTRLGLPRNAAAAQVAIAAQDATGRPALELSALLAGPVPVDDAALIGLARELSALEAAAAVGSYARRPGAPPARVGAAGSGRGLIREGRG